MTQTADVRNETTRVEAFSDGVFAIAITLLILEIRVPEHAKDGELLHALLDLWPSYLAFAASFFTIGVMWMNHHRLFNLIGKTNQGLLAANGLLLFGISFVPFPTAVLAQFLDRPDAQIAAVFYNGVFFFIAIAFQVFWRYASGQRRLIDDDADQESVDAITRQYRFGPMLYVVLMVIGWYSARTSLALNLALAVFFAIPARKFQRAR